MTMSNCENWLRNQIEAVTRKSAAGIGVNDDLCERIGLDSLDTLELLASIEDHFDFLFTDDDLKQYRTIGQILRAIGKHASAASMEAAA